MASKDATTNPPTRVTWVQNDGGTKTLRVQRAKLVVVAGKDKGSQAPLRGLCCVVGSAADCGLRLVDPLVSRHHCDVLVGDEGFRLTDLGSTNGTFANKLRIKEVWLSGGETIEVGQSKIRLVVGKEHDALPLSDRDSFGPVLGRSAEMRQVFALLERSANSDATILVEGETGTGKDLIAEATHEASPRRGGPLVVVDCAALQANLASSELFGHCKGAFTGADQDRAGAFEEAAGGTLFLDEVGELGLDLQPQLLRVLERRQVRRLGENHYRSVDVRLIAATNRDLEADVREGRFREDLFYRLSVVRVDVPPLRCRLDDIGPITRAILRKLAPDLAVGEVINEHVIKVLKQHAWPGNVRELRNVVERLLLFPDRPQAALGRPTAARQEHPIVVELSENLHEARRKWVERFEREYLLGIWRACDGVVSRAARQAGVSRQTFYRLMERHNITN